MAPTHGPHHVAQKSTTTTLPRSSFQVGAEEPSRSRRAEIAGSFAPGGSVMGSPAFAKPVASSARSRSPLRNGDSSAQLDDARKSVVSPLGEPGRDDYFSRCK